MKAHHLQTQHFWFHTLKMTDNSHGFVTLFYFLFTKLGNWNNEKRMMSSFHFWCTLEPKKIFYHKTTMKCAPKLLTSSRLINLQHKHSIANNISTLHRSTTLFYRSMIFNSVNNSCVLTALEHQPGLKSFVLHHTVCRDACVKRLY